MHRHLLRSSALAVLLVAASCSDDSGVPPPSDARLADAPGVQVDAKGSDAKGVDAKPAGDGPIASGSCPTTLPDANTVCTKEGLACEYGDNPRCLSMALCQSGKWLVAVIKCLPPDPSCPATREAAAGQSCSPKDAYCNYSGLTCDCTNCIKYPVQSCSGPLKWSCEAPNTDKSCPVARPNLGTVCTVEGKLCEYGCEPDVSRKCEGGIWIAASAPGGCPISTRSAKREIRYLDESARDRVAEEASRLRLATYRYRDPALGGRTHLGFILEDHPGSLASDMERRQVDLYSFASMTLALAQRQQRQLDELRAELAALKRSRCRR
jgi:hypothetical protein